jgi:Zn-finger nucleic acid-binding protein
MKIEYCPLCNNRVVTSGTGPDEVVSCVRCHNTWTLDSKEEQDIIQNQTGSKNNGRSFD